MLFLDEIGELGLDEQAMLLRAVEEKRFLPVGADRESSSNFQLIAGTNRDLRAEVLGGRFREDLLARINLWTFELPSLAERREDLEPNVEYELERFESTDGCRVTFNREARQRFLKFAESGDAEWKANFRDLNAAITRMATLAPAGRITADVVDDEVNRLKYAWSASEQTSSLDVLKTVLSDEQLAEMDLFDQSCLAKVVEVCKQCRSMAEAGRRLFAVSRRAKAQPNDSDRVKKLLGRFGLSWRDIHPE
jgi:transcriptional regulatory protein RtcR